MRRFVAATVVVAVLLSAACSEPPQKEIDLAQGAIDAARAAGAEQYAPRSFAAATTAMQETHDAVRQRDYRLALSRAIDAKERALEAATEAAEGQARARSEAEAAIASGANALRQLDAALKAAAANRVAAKETVSARAARKDADRALQEARAALAKADYIAAIAATKGLAERVTEEIRLLTAAMERAPARGKSRRR